MGSRNCAAAGCERHTYDGGDARLERISPTGPGRKFVGLCQDHWGTSVVLRPEATALLEGSGADRLTGPPCEDCVNEETRGDFCSKSEKSCEHHCDHSWSHDVCCWCGEKWEAQDA